MSLNAACGISMIKAAGVGCRTSGLRWLVHLLPHLRGRAADLAGQGRPRGGIGSASVATCYGPGELMNRENEPAACVVDVGERQAHGAGRPSSFPSLLVFLITGAVVPPGHRVRAGLDRVVQLMWAKPAHPRR